MKFFLTICIYNILLYAIPAHSQNLVSNCNLEKWSECPTDHSQIYYCENWYSPGEGTSDYCNGCSSNDFCSVPNNPPTRNFRLNIFANESIFVASSLQRPVF